MFLQVLTAFLQFGPDFLRKLIDLFESTPQIPGETEADYLLRLNAMAEAHLADARKNIDTVLADE